ncbi:MAG: molybdenum cofactor guanylyltransferase MobA [Aquabacterium sp.]
MTADITGCVLAGGEGRRMNGQDKGLIPYQGRPLADWALQNLATQTSELMLSANRHLPQYQALLDAWRTPAARQAGHAQTWPDDPDLPPRSGPLAGIITALRHCPTDWLMVVPCDMPHLPADLVSRLYTEARHTQTDIVVPKTQSAGKEARFQWVCALIHKRVCPHTEALFVKGERKAGRWVQSSRWSSVAFADDAAFANMNTLETLHGRA